MKKVFFVILFIGTLLGMGLHFLRKPQTAAVNPPLLPDLAVYLYADSSFHDPVAPESWSGPLPPARDPAAFAAIDETRLKSLKQELDSIVIAFKAVRTHPRAADADVLIKAVRYALDFHEWYDKNPQHSLQKAHRLLKAAAYRISCLSKQQTPWLDIPGVQVLGYYSSIDDSPQPYVVEVPPGLQIGAGQPTVPAWVFLHGRHDKGTDLYFIHRAMDGSAGMRFRSMNAVVVHPFGRYCNGFKSAGEIDVLECLEDATKVLNLDRSRTSLLGYSMGGAGAWHLGAHYADRWTMIHPGGGFVDVRRYQKLTEDKMPPDYEQTLWNQYDVPPYALNFFNTNVLSYDGADDPLRDGGDYMSEVLTRNRVPFKRIIEPGLGHGYKSERKTEIVGLLENASNTARPIHPDHVWLQTRSARYASMHWVHVLAVEKPWQNTLLEARLDETTEILFATTQNVTAFRLDAPWKTSTHSRRFRINEQDISFEDKRPFQIDRNGTLTYFFTLNAEGHWDVKDASPDMHMTKAGGTCMDDAFQSRFVIVLPDKPGRNPATDAWVNEESRRFIRRWRSLMRGDPRIIYASDFVNTARLDENLILWGDDVSNAVIARHLHELPVQWDEKNVTLGKQSYPAATHVPLLIHPFKTDSNDQRLIVLNTGITFREAHDKSNSLQNPKLPDWAVLDITTPANNSSAGKVISAGFSDTHWNLIQP